MSFLLLCHQPDNDQTRWGEQYWDQSPLSRAGDVKFDIVILAEVFSIPEVHEELLWTLQRFCHREVDLLL